MQLVPIMIKMPESRLVASTMAIEILKEEMVRHCL